MYSLIHANCSTLEWICFAPLRTLKTCNQTNIIWDAARIGLKFSHASILVKTWVCRELPRVGLCKVQYSLAVLPSVALTRASPGGRKKEIGDIDCLIFKMSYPKFLDYRNASTPRAFISFDIHHILEPYVIIRAMLWSIHTGLFKRLITRISIAL